MQGLKDSSLFSTRLLGIDKSGQRNPCSFVTRRVFLIYFQHSAEYSLQVYGKMVKQKLGYTVQHVMDLIFVITGYIGEDAANGPNADPGTEPIRDCAFFKGGQEVQVRHTYSELNVKQQRRFIDELAAAKTTKPKP